MSATTLSRRDRRTLTAGVAIILGLVVTARGIPAWLRWQRETRASAAASLTELARAESSLRLERAVRESLAARGERLRAVTPSLLSGDTPAAAAATLAGLVSGAAAEANVRLGAVQLRTGTADHSALTRVAVRGDATGDVQGIVQMLSALEQGPTLLAVRELSISQPEPAAPVSRVEGLHVDFVVEGLMLNRRPARAR